MNRASWLSIPLLLSLAACGGDSHADDSTGSSHRTPSQILGEGSPRPRGLVVRGTANPHGEVAPSIEQREDERVQIQKNIRVERFDAGQWIEEDVRGLSVRASCDAPETDCVELGRGGALRPPAWNGRRGGGQCVRPGEGVAVPNGLYRFVVATCEGNHRFQSEPFMVTH